MGEEAELVFLVISGQPLGRLHVERTARPPRELRVVRPELVPSLAIRSFCRENMARAADRLGWAPLPGQCCPPPRRPLRSRRKHKAGWSVTAWALG